MNHNCLLTITMNATDAASQNNGLSNAVQTQMMNAALNTLQNNSSVDMASVLSKIQALEQDKIDLKHVLEQQNQKISKLQEAKRAEMETLLNNTISKWVAQLDTKDPASKEKLLDGLNRIASSGDEQSGIWSVIACASSNWIANVNTIETLTNEVNSYREKEKMLQGGLFQDESNRVDGGAANKRKVDNISNSDPSDIWGEFEDMLTSKQSNTDFSRYVR
jgi:hypothetical protein